MVAVGTAMSGIVATITQWHDESEISRPIFYDIPGAMKLAALRHPAGDVPRGRLPVLATRRQLGTRASPTAARRTPRTIRRAAQGVPLRRLHADAAARPGRGADALAHLLPVPHPVRGHQRAVDRRAAADGRRSSSTATPTAPTSSSATSPASCSSSASAGPSSAATCSGRTGSSSRPGPRTPPSSARSC